MIPGFHEEIINIAYYVYFLENWLFIVSFWAVFCYIQDSYLDNRRKLHICLCI